MADITGSPENERLEGTQLADRIEGLGGDDELIGRGGFDTLLGGDGDDFLHGGAGTDDYDGGPGTDTASFYGATAPVTVDLGLGRARIAATPFETLVSIENAIGTDWNDHLAGGAGANMLWGGLGDDILTGGLDGDTLHGDGEDRFYGDYYGYRFDWGTDTARYDWFTADLEVVLASIDTYPRQQSYAEVAGQSARRDTLESIESVWTGSGNDRLTGDSGDNDLRGGAGNDTLIGGEGDDILWGQAGRDVIEGGTGSDTAVYAEVTTALRLDLRAQTVTGPNFDTERLTSIENVIAGSGRDVLIGTGAANVLDGGRGADTIRGNGGSDTVSYTSLGADFLVKLGPGFGRLLAGGERDRLFSIENATGGAGDDRLIGNGRANVLEGGDGDDLLRGNGGNDRFVNGAGDDRFIGGAGNDTFEFADFGPNDSKHIAPGVVAELADLGNDVVEGGAGSDTLLWNVPYTELTDTEYTMYYCGLFLEGSTDPDIVIDLRQGMARWDAAGTTASISSIERVVTGATNDVVYGTDADEIINVGRGANYVDAGGGDDRIFGSLYMPKRLGPDWDLDPYFSYYEIDHDYRDFSEVLRGGAGNDIIRGGAEMHGGAGDDILSAGRVRCDMTGGAGADQFLFWTGSGMFFSCDSDAVYDLFEGGRISDFEIGTDRIVIEMYDPSHLLPFGGYHAPTTYGEYTIEHTDSGSRVVLAYSEDSTGYSGVIINVDDVHLTTDDILFV